MSERMFRVTYTGDDVCAIPKVGVFQNGTTAVVDEAGADAARAQGKFSVVALSVAGGGDGAAPPAKAAPAAAEKPAEKQESEKAEKQDKQEKQGNKGNKDKPVSYTHLTLPTKA